MIRRVKKTGFVRKNDIYADTALLESISIIKVHYEEDEEVPSFGIAEALKLIAEGKQVWQLSPKFDSTCAGPFSLFTLPTNYTIHSRFVLAT
mgnify:CR=1 FL=1